MITAYERVISHCTRLSGLYASASGMTMPLQGDLSAFWRFLYIFIVRPLGRKECYGSSDFFWPGCNWS